ncbi:MAG: DNA polymerase III subunit delta [Saprospirales bacterium]|nr:MAG: DNA polymerase III subunit delta [Saprospirales bacterium]
MENKFKRIYLLHGEEDFLVNKRFSELEKQIVKPEFEDFNKFVYYGLDANPVHILDQASTFPMLGGPQLIVLRNANQFRKWDELVSYVSSPSDFTVLLIVHPEKKIDGRTVFYKKVKKLEKEGLAEIFEAKKLYDNKVPDWIVGEVKNLGYQIDLSNAALLAEYLGNNLEGIIKEINKMVLNLPEGSKSISEAMIKKYVGLSRKYSVFELQKSMAFGKWDKSSEIAYYMSQDAKSNPIYMITGALHNFFSRIYKVHSLQKRTDQEVAKALSLGHAFFAKEYVSAVKFFNKSKCEKIFDLLFQYDLKSKGIHSPSVDEPELLKALVGDIIIVGTSNEN